ncbi:hypothetical protein T440DRAFT_512523 [Plenodomus tracheiphilus IPT5]|uniref:Rhodopsin domain-containing protein n=1 Tax=Plenodomus tracheiphilus IPT5 TaxID=1408161 RepID=A0A6A7BMT3_9PLEO|nr:hypothetical protein T440DRAFT_512523 [Plenodomus tracheiphilus IPT5]
MFLVLTPYQKQKLVAWILVGASLVWLVTSLFLEGFQCHDFPYHCTGFYPRWLYISIVDILLEAGLIFYSIYIVSPRQMTTRAKLTVIFAFACRIPNIACTIIRLVFLHTTPTPKSSSFYTARLQTTTQLAIAYTITSCVVPYLRPLMQAHENSDGSLRRSSVNPSFKLSQGSSKESGNSRGKKYFKMSRASSAALGETGSRGVGERMAVSATYEDVGRLLGPQRVELGRSRSEEPPVAGGVKSIDWDLEHEIRPVVPLVLRGKPEPSNLSEPWRGRRPGVRSARSGEESWSFTAADFV